ncbi:hypothetical protein G4Y79_23635 [Phototrophicus methaneseepsis]|uniref:Uncharacterized protein n=1 Tax=Phototrophicus methaneseepsis TaxID=2710758 RepID=A0A7S8E940_9CHLR|nr:hypothetical protein [Phototrophicus methaneseepsis]QPC82644.1 hypothetical protein G4Y79_23635 [Phototrophicus methaneseepsis]
MQVIEHTKTRLVIERRRPFFAVSMALFTLLCAWILINIAIYGLSHFQRFNVFSFLSWLLWMALMFVIGRIGAESCYGNLKGTLCVFDRDAETVTVNRPDGFHMIQREVPIYAMICVDVCPDRKLRVFGLSFLLRDHTHVPLAMLPMDEEREVISLRDTIRRFLRCQDLEYSAG